MKIGFKGLATGLCLVTISVTYASDQASPCKGETCLYLAEALKAQNKDMSKVVESCSTMLGLDTGPEKCQKVFMGEFTKATIADDDLTKAAESITVQFMGNAIQETVESYLKEKKGNTSQKSPT